MKRCIFAVIAVLLAGVPALKSQGAAPHYTVENLGDFGGQIPAITAINAAGQMSGVVNGGHAVRYTPGVGWEDFPVLGGFSVANGINAAGDLVGYHVSSAGVRAFRYSDGGGVQDIDPLPGGGMTFGFAINAAGEVVGYGDAAGGAFRAFRAAPASSAAVELPNLGGAFTLACGINAAGQIAGLGMTPAGVQHAMRIDPGQATPVEITSFDGAGGSSTACAIDADGRVGGQADQAGAPHAFRFFGNSLLLLDTFGSSMSGIESIAGGTSVGWYVRASDDAARAFVHTEAFGSLDLNTLIDEGTGWVLSLAKGVNASGVIVGEGTYNGAAAIFRLTPSDEPPADTTAPVISAVTATPASIFPPNAAMVTVAVSISATDDADPSPACAVSGIDGHGAPAPDAAVTGPLSGSVRAAGGARYSFAVKCTDAAGNAATGSVDVVVPRDTTAPVITRVTATPSRIWPPDGRLVPVSIAVSATDNVDKAPACALTSIAATDATADDAAFTGALTARVRAVGGRTYTLTVGCSDAAGNSSTGSAQVVVPPDTTAPVITALVANPSTIWPPNKQFVAVSVRIAATDDVDASPRCALTSITGGLPGDARLTGALAGSVRSEKGNVYELLVTCSDLAGNSSEAVTSVSVVNKPSVAGLFRIVRILKAHKLHKNHKFQWHRRR
jgi:probable HAF family extracellular repeat protein